MGNPSFSDQRLGQAGTDFSLDTVNAELDHLHDRINKIVNNGQIFLSRVLIDNTYQLKPNDSYVGVDTSVRVVGITLPPLVDAALNKVYIIKDETNNAATKNITVYSNGAETIDGALTKVISSNSGVLRLFCTGTKWLSL